MHDAILFDKAPAAINSKKSRVVFELSSLFVDVLDL